MEPLAFIKNENGVETPKTCRWCLSTCDDLEPLPNDELGQYKLQKLFDCTDYQADILPGVSLFLCTKCESRLDKMYTFRWRCNKNIALFNEVTEKQSTVKNEADISKDHLGHSAEETVGTELSIKTEVTTPDAANDAIQRSCTVPHVNGTHECCGNQADDLFEAEENPIAFKLENGDVDEQDNSPTNPSELICQDREDRPVTTNMCVNDSASETIQNGVAAIDAGKRVKVGRKRKNDQGKTLHRVRSYKLRSDQRVNRTELICQDREDLPVTTNMCVNDSASESIRNGVAAIDAGKRVKVGRKRKNDQGKTLHRLRSYKLRSDQRVNRTELICQDREDRPVTTNMCVNDSASETIQNGVAAIDAGKRVKVGRKRKNDQGKTLHRLRSYKLRSDQRVNRTELICQDREDRPLTTNTCINDSASETIQNGIAAIDAGKHLKVGRKRKNDQEKTLHRLRSYKHRSHQQVDNGRNRKAHSKGHHNKKKHHCPHCSATYISPSQLKIHIRTHTGKTPVVCNICSKAFKLRSNLVRHSKIHNKDENQQCPHCPSKFADSSALKDHIRIHTGEKPFVCEICDQTFSFLTNLIRHKKVHNKDEYKQCPHCPSKCADSSALKDHIRIHTGEKPFVCEICDQTFSFLTNLIRHKKVHNKDENQQCPHCPSKFALSSMLKNHIRIHTAEKSFVCEICDQTFSFLTNLIRHKKVHNKDEYKHCPHCPSKCADSSALKDHIRIHTGEKPFVCEICDQTFSFLTNLIRHKKVHKKDEYQQCPHCPSKFALSSVLKNHVRIHTGEKPFVCKICKKTFHSRQTLSYHWKIHKKNQ